MVLTVFDNVCCYSSQEGVHVWAVGNSHKTDLQSTSPTEHVIIYRFTTCPVYKCKGTNCVCLTTTANYREKFGVQRLFVVVSRARKFA